MAHYFSPEHPTLRLSEKVRDICKDFFRSYDLTFFTFSRLYRDGYTTFLATHPNLLVDWMEQVNFKITFPETYMHQQSFSLLWDDILSEKHLKVIKKTLDHGLTMIHRYKSYYDTFSFAKSPGQPVFEHSFYLNNILAFENFSEQFLKIGKPLIKIAEDARFCVPIQDSNVPELFLPEKSQRHKIQGRFGETYMTTQEWFCCQLLHRGKTYKEISCILDISARTVETYILRLKDRTGYSTHELFRCIDLYPPSPPNNSLKASFIHLQRESSNFSISPGKR